MSDLVLNPKGFGSKVYSRFPPSYREDDIHTNYSLKRYLDACGEGGFKYAIEELNGILDFANPDQVSPQVLPILFRQYGLDIFHGIPEMYLRYLLPRLGEAWAKKGSLDVIDFVASAIAGVKTSTWVRCNQGGNVDVYLLFEMDYAIGDYFPDTKQFSRLLEKFLPFYLDMAIIYVYVFHDESSVHGEDTPRVDVMTYTTSEKGLFYSSGLHAVPVTFPSDLRGLNVGFVLNQYERVAPDPDLFRDNVGVKYHESGSFAHRFTQLDLRIPMLNTNRMLNHNFVLHGGKFRIEVDNHFDKVITVPMMDTITPKVIRDENKDHMVMKPSFYHALNTGLVLNGDFTLNADNCEYGLVRGVDESNTDISNTTYREGATFVFSPLLCMLTNTLGLVLNHAALKVPDEVNIVQYRDGSRQTIFL